jgi:Fe-Mn family superoxide dismutase
VINGLKREELIASNSMILHELYFDSLGGGSQPGGDLRGQLARDFGTVEKWEAQFSAIGKALGGGSGLGASRRHRILLLKPRNLQCFAPDVR